MQTKSKVYRLTSSPGHPWVARCVAPSQGDWVASEFTKNPELADRLKAEVTSLEQLRKLRADKILIVASVLGDARMADHETFSVRTLANGLKIHVQNDRAGAVWIESGTLFVAPLSGTPILLFHWNDFRIAAIDSPNILQVVIDAYASRFQLFEPGQLKMHAYFAAPKHCGDKYARIRLACESQDVRGSYEYRLPADQHYPHPNHEDPGLRQTNSLCLLFGCNR